MFRFENLEIWKRSADVGLEMFDLADQLDEMRKYRFAEQLRAAALSISNNIAEGSGSTSDKVFANFLDIARRSTFECANMILIFARKGLVRDDRKEPLMQELDEISRMITSFSATLNRGHP